MKWWIWFDLAKLSPCPAKATTSSIVTSRSLMLSWISKGFMKASLASRIGIGIEIDKNLCKKSLVEIDSKKIKFLSDYNKKPKNQNIIYEGLFKNLKWFFSSI